MPDPDYLIPILFHKSRPSSQLPASQLPSVDRSSLDTIGRHFSRTSTASGTSRWFSVLTSEPSSTTGTRGVGVLTGSAAIKRSATQAGLDIHDYVSLALSTVSGDEEVQKRKHGNGRRKAKASYSEPLTDVPLGPSSTYATIRPLNSTIISRCLASSLASQNPTTRPLGSAKKPITFTPTSRDKVPIHPYSRANDLSNDRSVNPSPREILRAQQAEEEKAKSKAESVHQARLASIAKREKKRQQKANKSRAGTRRNSEGPEEKDGRGGSGGGTDGMGGAGSNGNEKGGGGSSGGADGHMDAGGTPPENGSSFNQDIAGNNASIDQISPRQAPKLVTGNSTVVSKPLRSPGLGGRTSSLNNVNATPTFGSPLRSHITPASRAPSDSLAGTRPETTSDNGTSMRRTRSVASRHSTSPINSTSNLPSNIGASRLHPSAAALSIDHTMARSSSVGAASLTGLGIGLGGSDMKRASSLTGDGSVSLRRSSHGSATSTAGSDLGMALRTKRDIVLPRNLRDYEMRVTPA